MVEVRALRRGDRQQVTALVNAHVQAVLPGVTLSVNAVLSQLEREPGEFIVDPWVAQRATLVAVERGRVVVASQVRPAAFVYLSPGGAPNRACRRFWVFRRRFAPWWVPRWKW